MHTHNAGGALCGSCQSSQGNGGGVGCEDGVRRADFLQFFKYGALGFEIFEHGFDYQIGIGSALDRGIQRQASQSCIAGAACHAALFHIPEHGLFDTGFGAFQCFHALVVQGDGVAAANGVLGNTAAHKTGTNNEDLFNGHHKVTSFPFVLDSGVFCAF